MDVGFSGSSRQAAGPQPRLADQQFCPVITPQTAHQSCGMNGTGSMRSRSIARSRSTRVRDAFKRLDACSQARVTGPDVTRRSLGSDHTLRPAGGQSQHSLRVTVPEDAGRIVALTDGAKCSQLWIQGCNIDILQGKVLAPVQSC
jgi:hypothetical protein